jgi:zinc protease
VAKAKEILIKQQSDGLKDNDYWLESLSNAWIDHQDPAWINEYAGKAAALSAADVQATAVKYFRLDNFVQAVLNPETGAGAAR